MMVNNNCTIARLAVLLFFIQQISGYVVPRELVPENLVFRDPESESGLAINEDVLNQLLKTLYSPSKSAVRTDDDDQSECECCDAEEGDEQQDSHGEEDNGQYSHQTDNSNCYQQSATEVPQNNYSQLPQKQVQPQETTGFFYQQMNQSPTNSYRNTGERLDRGWNQQTMTGFGQREQQTTQLKNQHLTHGTQQEFQQKSPGRMMNMPHMEPQRTLVFNGCQPVHRDHVRPQTHQQTHQQKPQQQQTQQQQPQQQQPQQQQEPRRRLQIGTVSVRRTSPA